MERQLVLCEHKGSIATVTLNRPDKLNAMNDQMLTQFGQILEELEADVDTKAVLIKGAGKAFSVGQDLIEQGDLMMTRPSSPETTQEIMLGARRRARLWEYLFNLEKPTIAQIHGYCLGSACSLVMSCDLAIASEDSVIGDPSVRMGLLPDSPLWLWIIGQKKARELLLTGAYVTGKESEVLGLVNQAVSPDTLPDVVWSLAEAIALIPLDGLVIGKEGINSSLEARGIGAAWRYTSDFQMAMHNSHLKQGEFDFFAALGSSGLSEAVRQRDTGLNQIRLSSPMKE